MLTHLNSSIKQLINNKNVFILKKKKIKKAKTLLYKKRMKTSDNKQYYKSDLEIESKKKNKRWI